VCLQEVTSSFEKILHKSPTARSQWLLTRLEDEQAVTGMRYGTIFLVRKALVMERGCTAAVSFSLYPGSECGRGISVLELIPPKRNPVSTSGIASPSVLTLALNFEYEKIVIGNTHLEYTVPDRRAQMQFCIRALSSTSNSLPPALCVLCGDTNIESYSEIADSFLSSGYLDALVAANSPPSPPNDEGRDGDREDGPAALDLFQYMPTFGRAGIRFTDKASKERVGRLDYILCGPGPWPSNNQNDKPEIVDNSRTSEPGSQTRRLLIHGAGLLGSEALSNEVVKKEAGVDDPEMSVFPSDHLGVYAVVVL
jgi:endonuclease/exonuclease/phosphatase family metal-dependent hydrolase